jgi:hypothetical protein
MPSAHTETPRVDAGVLTELCEKLKLRTDDARLFLEIALALIFRLEAQPPGAATATTYDTVERSTVAPSASELAEVLAELSSYDNFARAKVKIHQRTARADWDGKKLAHLLVSFARLTGIGSSTPPLVDVSSYRSYQRQRPDFWRDLYQLFRNKREPTSTHRLVALAAANYIRANKNDFSAPDLLIITSNYDCLLEQALDEQPLEHMQTRSVPYYVLTTVPSRESSRVVDVRFSPGAQEYLGVTDRQFVTIRQAAFFDSGCTHSKTPDQFAGLTNRPHPLVTVYKIHGSLHEGATHDKDGVVITNEDYVTFLSANSVPGYVRTRLQGMSWLLLGYSFNDWNVRSLYQSVSQLRAVGSTGDYVVLLDPSPYETAFFDANKINVLDTTLDVFCRRMRESVDL